MYAETEDLGGKSSIYQGFLSRQDFSQKDLAAEWLKHGCVRCHLFGSTVSALQFHPINTAGLQC